MHPQLKGTLDRAMSNPNYGFDTIRDELTTLPHDVLPELLAAAHDPAFAPVFAQMVAALGDLCWPGAYDAFVLWATGEDVDVWAAVDAGCALDRAGGGGFGYWQRVAPGDNPSPELVLAARADLAAWWAEQGKANAPDEAAWQESLGRPPTPDERTYAFVRDSGWAVLSNGIALQTEEPLPANAGEHLTGGVIVVGEREANVAVVLGGTGVVRVMAEFGHGWMDVTGKGEVTPNHQLGATALSDFRSDFEIGPTGSLKPRG